MPGQRREALARGHVPHLDRGVARHGDDAPAVGEDGDAINLNQADHTPPHRTQKQEGAAPHMFRMPGQRREALARGHVPHLDRLVPRPGDDAPPVGEDGDATNLNQGDSQPSTQKTETRTPHHTVPECPASVATRSPVATSHTLTVLSADPETTRRPSGKTATPLT